MGHLLPGFFGFLCCKKFTFLSQRSYDPATHLSYSDIAVDDCDNPSLVVIYIRWVFSAEVPALYWVQPRIQLSSESSNILLSKTGFTSRPPFHLREPTIPYITGFLIAPHEAVTGSKSGPFLLQYTQLQNWGSHISKGCRTNRITNQKSWEMEKQCLPLLHQTNTLPASHIFNSTGF